MSQFANRHAWHDGDHNPQRWSDRQSHHQNPWVALLCLSGQQRSDGKGCGSSVGRESCRLCSWVNYKGSGWRSVHHIVHLICWHTGHSVTADLVRIASPLIDRLIHHSVMLAIHPLSSLALALLTKKDDRMAGRFVQVNLNFVKRIVAFGAHLGFCHESIIRGQVGRMGQTETTSSGVTFNHLIGCPVVIRQIVAGSVICKAIRYAPLIVEV